MLIEKILQAIFEDGRKFQNIESTSHIPDMPEMGELQAADSAITDHLTIDQNKWQGEWSRYPTEVWQRLKRDAFAAGVQGRDAYNQAADIFGQSDPASFDADIEYIKEWLDKAVVLQPVHLGKGEQGILRRLALETLAGEAGHWWNREPSIGRWLVALANTQIAK